MLVADLEIGQWRTNFSKLLPRGLNAKLIVYFVGLSQGNAKRNFRKHLCTEQSEQKIL
jgi:hypothetical protein